MQYAIFIYANEEDYGKGDNPMPAYIAYTQALMEAGIMTGGAGLQLSHTATTLRLQNGHRQVQDGPFADTKEQLGGFYLIEVPDLDAALDWAARCPGASLGAVEIRPLLPNQA